MANMNNKLEYINDLAKDNPEALVARSELRYKNIISNIAEHIVDDMSREIVMLAGPSASGKTTTANKIANELTRLGVKTYVVSLDDFYKNRVDIPGYAEGNPDFETVEALDLPCLAQTLKSLMSGVKTRIPIFDFTTGTRSEHYNEIELGRNDVVVVEGLHALNPVVTQDIEGLKMLKIYVSVSSRIYDAKGKIILNKRNIRFLRRLIRDYNFRASSVENTFNLWQSVCAGEDKYLFPFRDCADIRINSIHLCEPCLYKDIALEMLEGAQLSESYAKDAKKLINALKMFESVSLDMVSEDSLLREFIG